ncbi:MAG TPA: hypothetical protein VJN62_02260 [Gemmatimonadales bacterium]|nr:hypothetical protein [Gemmatimonadales bacterium]
MSKSKKPTASETPKGQPTDAAIKSAFKLWMGGGLSLWDVKGKTHIRAAVLQPAFEKLLGKKIKSPAQRMPVKGAKSAKEEPQARVA